ncbi:hypothetical protein CIFAM_09_00890 [Citrobacter farmeri GTC 1319]|nr:hypothetical protein CIFAM_09_00890 [Citrobacter farmeri GTC 1319]
MRFIKPASKGDAFYVSQRNFMQPEEESQIQSGPSPQVFPARRLILPVHPATARSDLLSFTGNRHVKYDDSLFFVRVLSKNYP